MTSDAPPGFTFDPVGIIYGKRQSHPGLLEIKLHNPKKKNAFRSETILKITEIIHQAEEDKEIKVIMLHGGKFFSAG